VRRREFVGMLGGFVLVSSSRAGAAFDKLSRIGVLHAQAETDSAVQAGDAAFGEPLNELGWVAGRNITAFPLTADASPWLSGGPWCGEGGLDMTVWPCKSGAMTSKGMIIDVGGWLRGLGLGQYEAAFRQNEIDERVLPSLTREDLKEIGVGPVGHRRRLLDAIALLRSEPATKAPLEAPSTLPNSVYIENVVSLNDCYDGRRVEALKAWLDAAGRYRRLIIALSEEVGCQQSTRIISTALYSSAAGPARSATCRCWWRCG
jgi:hypothetical protein